MDKLVRFGVAVPGDLLQDFDVKIEALGVPNRSEAIRKLIRDFVSKETWSKEEGRVYGSITIAYNHHGNDATGKLTEIQHDYGDVITSTTHVHIDHFHCLETIILSGETFRVKALVDVLTSLKAIVSITPVIMAVAGVRM